MLSAFLKGETYVACLVPWCINSPPWLSHIHWKNNFNMTTQNLFTSKKYFEIFCLKLNFDKFITSSSCIFCIQKILRCSNNYGCTVKYAWISPLYWVNCERTCRERMKENWSWPYTSRHALRCAAGLPRSRVHDFHGPTRHFQCCSVNRASNPKLAALPGGVDGEKPPLDGQSWSLSPQPCDLPCSVVFSMDSSLFFSSVRGPAWL